MSDASNRRSLFKLLFSEARGVAAEMVPVLPEPARSRRPAARVEPQWTPPAPVRPERAAATTHTATAEELMALAAELGLDGHRDDVLALALSSVRLRVEDDPPEPGSSWLRTGLLDEGPVLSSTAPRTIALAQLDLAALLPAGATLTGQPDAVGTTLRCQIAARQSLDGAAAGLLADVELMDEPVTDAPDGARAVTASTELVLPRVWSAVVQALGLEGDEHDAWVRLRGRLGEVQGVVAFDGGQPSQLRHRLLGYPDDFSGDMPLECELLDGGIDLGDDPPSLHPAIDGALRERSRRWRMLLQLTADEPVDWRWPGGAARLFVWVPAADLEAGDLSRAVALAR